MSIKSTVKADKIKKKSAFLTISIPLFKFDILKIIISKVLTFFQEGQNLKCDLKYRFSITFYCYKTRRKI